jgi:hypothetical protein
MAIDEQELQEMKEYRDPLTEKLAELEEKGYRADFKLEGGKLKVVKGDQSFSADELTIRKDFRFEGESNPDDMSILYALEAQDGTKGTVVHAYGPDANDALSEFMKGVKEEGDAGAK